MANKVYKIVTDKVIELLNKDIVPWKKPWTVKNEFGDVVFPQNMVSRKNYRGINSLFLNCLPYERPFYLTKNQIFNLGGMIKYNELKKYQMIFFWKLIDVLDEDEEDLKKIPFLRFYQIWNIDQTTGIPEEKIPVINVKINNDDEGLKFKPIKKAEKIINGFIDRPTVNHRGNRAYYLPRTDEIDIPEKEKFINEEEYYCTLFHEFAHSTGHETRLNRKEALEFHYHGDPVYSKEELTAEMTAAFLCGVTGIEQTTLKNSAMYIHGWLKKIKLDNRLVIHAAARAEKAANYILGKHDKNLDNETK